jgi:hypothetical protein
MAEDGSTELNGTPRNISSPTVRFGVAGGVPAANGRRTYQDRAFAPTGARR